MDSQASPPFLLCPNCSANFFSAADVVQHLSTDCPCRLLANQNLSDIDQVTVEDDDTDASNFAHHSVFHFLYFSISLFF